MMITKIARRLVGAYARATGAGTSMPELVCSADSPQWLTERRKGITATDITAIVGLSPYESAYSLFFKKRGDIPDEHTDNDRLRLGRELEPIITARWIEEVATMSDSLYPTALWRSDARPWQLATPDRVIRHHRYVGEGDDTKSVYDAVGVLELKSWADIDRHTWADGPPARVRAQVLWQMDTLDVATGHVGVLFLPSGEFRSYVIDNSNCDGAAHGCPTCRDRDLLRQAGQDFMDRLDSNDPPSPDASSATLAALKARFADPLPGKEAEIGIAEWDLYQIACEDVEFYKNVKQQREATIREQAGEAKYLTVNGTRVATRIVGDSPVKAHTRHNDYIRRAASKGETE